MLPIGSRVKYINPEPYGRLCYGMSGTIRGYYHGTFKARLQNVYIVDWDDDIGSSNWGNLCRHGHGWGVPRDDVCLSEEDDGDLILVQNTDLESILMGG